MIQQDLTPGIYSEKKRGWWKGSDSKYDGVTEITLVTYNVNFSEYHSLQRNRSLIAVLEECNADIIALQEVTHTFLRRLLGTDWIRKSYSVSDFTGFTIGEYGILMLSRLPVLQMTLHELPSFMQRRFLVSELRINNSTIKIGTVHLESTGDFHVQRAHQLRLIFEILENSDHSVLMGDMNFCASWKQENMNIDSRYQDLWSALKNDDKGYTMIPNRRWGQVRFDRILMRSSMSGWKPKSIRLIGTEGISPSHPYVYPSDHYGLVAQLEWKS